MTFTLVFWQGFGGPDGINYVVKTASVAGALAGIGRGENLPYFGKQSDNKAYFPQELKRRVSRVFPYARLQ
jgi:hypothetical protein